MLTVELDILVDSSKLVRIVVVLMLLLLFTCVVSTMNSTDPYHDLPDRHDHLQDYLQLQ